MQGHGRTPVSCGSEAIGGSQLRRGNADVVGDQRVARCLDEFECAWCVAMDADRIEIDVYLIALDCRYASLHAGAQNFCGHLGWVEPADAASENDRATRVVVAIGVELADHGLAQFA